MHASPGRARVLRPGRSSTVTSVPLPIASHPPALDDPDRFLRRHLGPDAPQVAAMLAALGLTSLDDLVEHAVPAAIRRAKPLSLPQARSEHRALADLRAMAAKNQVFRSYIGMGYSDCLVPPVIQRNVLENPGWYTQYTPYQAEIAQGRLEGLLTFQTMVADLTGLPVANASLLDEATAAAEAMHLCHGVVGDDARTVFFVARDCHPQTIDVVRTRAQPLGIEVIVGDHRDWLAKDAFPAGLFGVLLQYPATDGAVRDYRAFIAKAHAVGAKAVVATDLLALTLLTPPGEFGADVAVGSAQRFGVPLGYGGPHAAFMAVREEHKRHIPGRLVGVSKDVHGKPALRLALQTREQHIRREKATSNICTAQALLANMAAFYAVYHGPDGLRSIAKRVHRLTAMLAEGLARLGFAYGPTIYFDTLRVDVPHQQAEILRVAHERRINLRAIDAHTIGVSLDEATDESDVAELLEVFNRGASLDFAVHELALAINEGYSAAFARTSGFLGHPVFTAHHSETEMLRYLRRLESRDLSLCHSMIPLGSCTMKLNATAEMLPVSWPEFSRMHPFAPKDQAQGYQQLFQQLEEWLAEITGFAGVSLQPNAGSQGEYAGLLVIRAWHASRGDGARDICLIPTSAHGTNPATATMAGMTVVPVACDARGNIDVADLTAKAEQHAARLACLMVTYPSTHGVFEESIIEISQVVHRHGGQVYMDGANMNAQVGLTSPGAIGADVCHLNLHKTFCIPHGGGGPGMGPIGVAKHLAPFLPGHPIVDLAHPEACGTISAAPWGSAAILPISWAYIALMGYDGLTEATKIAILNANYVARRLKGHYEVLYSAPNGLV
ncbi:MAG: aminomethyl-transferring glycine dehydrogenase, partial [Planctomycetes bacterium]|nr:aminomethyl-transferring glycine dehydrogenase [Planctomycetota bacterium]